MADKTLIGWTDATLNLWWGCTKVSQGCKHCYAEQFADGRYNKGNWGPTGTRREVKSWRKTLREVSERAKAEGRRLKVFCQSMSDTFEGPDTMGGEGSPNWATVSRLQGELFDAIAAHPHLDFQVLTKRPENVKGALVRCGRGFQDLPPHFWIGTSVEDQGAADARVPHLLGIPAAVRFLSCEPLIGAVDLSEWLPIYSHMVARPTGGDLDPMGAYWPVWLAESGETPLQWLIVGGESGPGHRTMDLEWSRSLVGQAHACSVPVFVKQDSGARSGLQGRIPDDLWARKEFPKVEVPHGG